MERDHATAPPDVRKLLASSRFLREIDATNYMMSNRQKVCLAMLIEGELWRAHYKQMFRYEHGAWVTQTELKVEGWNILIALEGLFLEIAKLLEEREEQIPWSRPVDSATSILFKQVDAACFHKLLVDWPRLAAAMQREGGDEGFGNWETWGNAFDNLHKQERWDGAAFEMEKSAISAHSNLCPFPGRGCSPCSRRVQQIF